VLAKIRSRNRVEVVGETFRAALNSLAVVAPQWLKEQIQQEWIERSEHRVEDYRLPDGKQAREADALVIGPEGLILLNTRDAPEAPSWLREVPAVQTLRRVWLQNCWWEEGELRWRSLADLPAAGDCGNAPSDPEAQSAKKRDTGWVGYQVQLTETCDDDRPHLITPVETTPAPLADRAALPPIHEALEQQDLFQNDIWWIPARWMQKRS
jgi:transposase